jgi:hypothetical protein
MTPGTFRIYRRRRPWSGWRAAFSAIEPFTGPSVVTNDLNAGTAAALYEPLLPPINRSNHSGGAHSRKATIGLTEFAGARFQPALGAIRFGGL